jgi:hypothetical protein
VRPGKTGTKAFPMQLVCIVGTRIVARSDTLQLRISDVAPFRITSIRNLCTERQRDPSWR